MPIADTNQRHRARIRRGRTVRYNPTTAQAAANGAGPWFASITNIDAAVRFPAQIDGFVLRADGTTAALSNVLIGGGSGQASLI